MSKECIICYEPYNICNKVLFRCWHEVCINCYIKLVHTNNNNCPLCRLYLPFNNSYDIMMSISLIIPLVISFILLFI